MAVQLVSTASMNLKSHYNGKLHKDSRGFGTILYFNYICVRIAIKLILLLHEPVARKVSRLRQFFFPK